METLSAAAVIPLAGGGGGGSGVKDVSFNTAKTILTMTKGDDTTVKVFVLAEGNALPSGTEAGERFRLLQDIEQASGVVAAGLYRFNGSSWDKESNLLYEDSAEDTEIYGSEVPKLTNGQVTEAYNSIVAGRAVIIRNAAETISLYADAAVADEDSNVAVYSIYAGKIAIEWKTNDGGDDEDADISGIPVGGIVVDIGSGQYVHDGYSLPAIAKAKLDELYANHKKGISQVAKWTLLGSESYFGIVSADCIAGNYSVDLLVHNKYHCSYTWADATTGNVNPEVISGDLETFVFKGYVSTEQPANAKLNELWYSSSTMPTTFPVNVKRYDGTSWSTTTEQYTPKALEMWANANDSHGYYWFNGWNEIDVTVDPDDVTIGKNALGQLELKDKGHDFAKLTDASVGAGLEKSSDGKTIQHKNSVTAGTHQAVVQTQSSATGTEGGSLAFKKHNFDAQGHSTQADQADSTVTMEAGLRLYGNKLGHTNSITAQTTAKVWKSTLDAQGHNSGTQTGYDVHTAMAATPVDTALMTEKAISTALDGIIEEFEPSVALASGIALDISKVEANAKVIVYGGKWLEFNSYFSKSVSQASAGWVSAVKVNPNFKYTIDTSRQSRTLGSMWAEGAYQNTAFSRLSGGDIVMYYYGPLLNQTGGVNAMLRIPVKLK